MKAAPLMLAMACTMLGCAPATRLGRSETGYVYLVGTDAQGRPIQQVEWLYNTKELKEKHCPIWAGTVVEVVEEQGERVKIKCDKAAVPHDERWQKANIDGGVVFGWLERKCLVKVRMKDLK